MKKYLLTILAVLLLPLSAYAATTQGWAYFNGLDNFNHSSTTPTFDHITSTSTATSTFGGGINMTGGCFSISGVCVGSSAAGTTTDSYIITTNGTTYKAYNQGNGFTDSNSSFDTIWTDVMSNSGTASTSIILGNGSFLTSNGLTVTRGNISIKGQGSGVTSLVAASTTALDSTSLLYIAPTSQPCSAKVLTADATVGDLTLTVSPTDAETFTAGDYIILYSSLSIDTEFSNRNQGEFHQILSVATSTGVITLAATNSVGAAVFQSMSTANSASICKLTMLQNVSVSGITFTDNAAYRPTTLTTGSVLAEFVRGLWIQNNQFEHVWSSGVHVRQVWDYNISGNRLNNILQVFPQTTNVFYGIQVRGASLNGIISGNLCGSMRHCVTQGAGSSGKYSGTTRNYNVVGNTAVGTFVADFDAHQGAEECNISNNTMIGDDGSANGIQTRSVCTVNDNDIRGIFGNGISFFGASSGSVAIGNNIQGGSNAFQMSNGVRNIRISNNVCNGGTRCVLMNRTSTTVTISIATPAVITDTGHSISIGTELTFATTGDLPTGITAGTNYYVIAEGMSPNSYEISATLNGSAVNTSGTQSGTQTRRYYSGTDSVISNNSISNETTDGIDADGQLRVDLTNNRFDGNTKAVRVQDTDSRVSGWDISGNRYNNNTNPNTISGSYRNVGENYGSINFSIGTTTPWRALSVYGLSDLGNDALAGTFTSTSTTGTSTFAGALGIGTSLPSSWSNLVYTNCNGVFPASVSTGGCVHVDSPVGNTGTALNVTVSAGASASGRGIVFNQTNSADVQDFILASSSASNTTALNVKGDPTGKGIIKIEHTGSGTGFSNGSGLSIDTTINDAQGVFIKTGTGIPLNILSSGSATLFKVDNSGNSTTTGFIDVNGSGTSTFAGPISATSFGLNTNYVTNLTGTGLALTSGTLSATLGTNITPNELNSAVTAGGILIGTNGTGSTFVATGSPTLTIGSLIATSTTLTSAFSGPISASGIITALGGIDLTNVMSVGTSTILGLAYDASSTQSLNAGTNADNVLASTTIKANTLGPTGVIRITAIATTTNSANNKVVRVKFGGTTFQSATLTTTAEYYFTTIIQNRNATNSQISFSSPSFGTGAGLPVKGSIDTTKDQPLQVTCSVANAAEWCSIESYLVEIIR